MSKSNGGIKAKQEVKIHEAASISPDMTDEEFRELAEGIREHGLLQKIVMLGTSFAKSELLDGRHRWRALQELGMPLQPNSRLLSAKDVPDPEEYVFQSCNRRNLTTGQRAMMAARRAKKHEGRPVSETGGIPPVMSNKQAADSVNVGIDAVKDAKKVTEQGCVGLQRMVINGSVSVSAAAEVSTLPKDEQAKIVKSGSDAVKEEAARIRKGSKPSSNGHASNGKPPKQVEPKSESVVEREPGDDTETEAAASRPKFIQEAIEETKVGKSMLNSLTQLKKTSHTFCETKAGSWIDQQDTDRLIDQISLNIKMSLYECPCPSCKFKPVKKCLRCSGRGWLDRAHARQNTDEDKLWLKENE